MVLAIETEAKLGFILIPMALYKLRTCSSWDLTDLEITDRSILALPQ